jgi:hypothetical protein
VALHFDDVEVGRNARLWMAIDQLMGLDNVVDALVLLRARRFRCNEFSPKFSSNLEKMVGSLLTIHSVFVP